MHCMLMDLLHGFEVLSTTEETLFNSRNVSRLVQNNIFKPFSTDGLTWQTNIIRYLGVNISINHDDNISFVNENFLPFLNEMKSILDIWTSKGLTLLRKITIIKKHGHT